MDMRERIEKELGWFERTVQHIPGYRGYKEKELAREADSLVRGNLTKGINAEVDRLTDVQRQLLDSGGIKYLDDVDGIIRRLQTLATTIRTASYGYSGLFDAVKVKEEELDALYRHDATLLESLPSLTAAVDALGTAVSDLQSVPRALMELTSVVNTMRQQWDRRRDALLQAGIIQ
ncbi:MAG: hypothetical protein ACUVWR_06940 [Anaerolineae bacterium]